MVYANAVKIGIKMLILTTSDSLHSNNLAVEHALHKALKFFKETKDIRFMMNEVNPWKFTEVINKAHIILFIIK
jgi:hypothetical protein